MPSTIATPLAFNGFDTTAVMNQVDGALKYFGFDLVDLTKKFDIKTVGIVALVVILGIVIFDIFSFNFARAGATPLLGRSMAVTAAKAWIDRPSVQGR